MLKSVAAAFAAFASVSLVIAAGTTETGARVLEDAHTLFSASGAQETAQETAYPSLVTAPEHMKASARVERMMMTDLHPRLREDVTLVVTDLSAYGAAGMVDWRATPHTLYIAPMMAERSEDDGLLWVLTHEMAHVRQFTTYGIDGTTWLDQRRMQRLMADAHKVLPEAESGQQAVEMLADCMSLSVLDGDVAADGHTAYLEDRSACSSPEVSSAVDSLLDGERLSAWGW